MSHHYWNPKSGGGIPQDVYPYFALSKSVNMTLILYPEKNGKRPSSIKGATLLSAVLPCSIPLDLRGAKRRMDYFSVCYHLDTDRFTMILVAFEEVEDLFENSHGFCLFKNRALHVSC